MKILQIFAVAVVVLSCGAFQCTPSHERPGLVGKLVINGPCGNYVVQIVSGDYDHSKVVPVWKDPATDTTYTNVFTVKNRCTFGGYGIQKGQLFTFLMNDSVIVQNGMVCKIYVAVPPLSNTVTAARPLP